MQLHAIGIDLGKTLFHLVGVDSAGNIVVKSGVLARSYCPTLPMSRSI